MKLKFRQDLKFDLDPLIGLKNSIKFKDSMPWVRCAFGNVSSHRGIITTLARITENL